MWSGNKNKNGYHLCSWISISKPKFYGGWGLHNIFVFYKALASNTLWRALMKSGLSKRVIKDKYIMHDSILSYLHSVDSFSSFCSRSWKNIQNTLPVILHWMVWNPSSGHSISIGRDAIIRLGQHSYLSQELITLLNCKNLHLLF
jgi:hypothetical protein